MPKEPTILLISKRAATQGERAGDHRKNGLLAPAVGPLLVRGSVQSPHLWNLSLQRLWGGESLKGSHWPHPTIFEDLGDNQSIFSSLCSLSAGSQSALGGKEGQVRATGDTAD